MPVWDIPARIWTLARKVEDLLELQGKTRTALEAVDSRLRALEERMAHLEAGQDRLVTEAKAAAGTAATGLAATMLSDIVSRVTRIEVRQEEAQRRLPPG